MPNASGVEELDVLDPRRLSLELCKSIRDIDSRLDELRIVLNGTENERRKSILDRVERLIETRFCLLHSLMDINPGTRKLDESSANPFNNIRITYDLMKRKIT